MTAYDTFQCHNMSRMRLCDLQFVFLREESARYGQKRLTNTDCCSSRHVAQLLSILSALRTEGMVQTDMWLVKERLC
jgi:hypothetical protein